MNHRVTSDVFVGRNCIKAYDEPPIFHCFDQRQKSSMNLSTECVSFMWSKILIDALKDLSSMIVYHGQHMSQFEIDQLQNNIGNLISTNSFWSTSMDKEVAIKFATESQSASDQYNVLFQINVDAGLRYALFASIETVSAVPQEREVIFSLFTVFEICEVQCDQETNLWHVNLMATDKGNEIYEEYKTILRKEADADNIHIIFGCLMIT